ncbi:hypothetical protein BDN72DRAFT_898843 [Pluteus cervinus]|uniref:Uncharacterized protein n=1 Tax=Pluteus cervinus TaxID=181527 RepID=A0ACD3AQL0_9AGAR|nr:hypothetical protein BDN72DRAFT_898843 [Pluteus cervinus]
MSNKLLARDALLSLAKQQLNLSSNPSSDGRVPTEYLDELRRHLSSHPNDYHFLLALEPGRGLGKVKCLERRCNRMDIPLVPRLKTSDGGRSVGFGSLSAYSIHVAEHPTHSIDSQARVRGSRGSYATDSAQQTATSGHSALLDLLDRTTAPNSAPVQSTRSVQSLKREPTEVALPPARSSVTVFNMNSSQQGMDLPAKGVKTEGSWNTKKPLSSVNSNSLISMDGNAVTDLRQRIREIQEQLSPIQTALDRLRVKRRPSKADRTRIVNLTQQMNRLNVMKAEYIAAIPAASPVKKPQSKALPYSNQPALPAPFHVADRKPVVQPLPQPVASGSNAVINNPRMPNIRPPPIFSESESDPEADYDMDAWDSGDENIVNEALEHIGPIIPNVFALDDSAHDSNGDWHGRGRDTFVGPRAKADDIEKFLVEAGNAEQFDGNASVDKALEKLGLESQYDLIPGMEVALMPHQTIGVAWMLEKEQSPLKGGCLGDDMGLGKTIQMIALMIKNKSADPLCKTNLIVAPTALLDQWKLEIELKTNCDLKCLIYHGSSKPKRKKDLIKYDVVLTTYSTMALEWPDLENEEKKKIKAKKKKPAQDFVVSDSDDDDDRQPGRKRRKEAGLLFQVDFYRVILDEAQAIRNRRTRTSRAVTDLRGEYRWCLTGTPIINGLGDMYGYLRFLKIRPWYDFQEFQGHIGRLERKNPQLAVSRLPFLYRRMKDTELDGKRLIELPPKTVDLVKLDFTPDEREIYDMVETRTQQKFNRYLRSGTVLKNYHQVLVLLLRLRQICSHPSLIQEEGGLIHTEGEKPDAESVSNELARAKRLVSAAFVKKVQEKLKETMLARVEAEKESEDAIADDEECPICYDMLTNPVVTACGHIFCRECICDVLNMPMPANLMEQEKFKVDERPCPSCRSPVTGAKLFSRAAFEPADEELLGGPMDIDSDEEYAARKSKGKGRASSKRIQRPQRKRKLVVLDSDEEDEEDTPKAKGKKRRTGDDSDYEEENDDNSDDEYEQTGHAYTRLGKRRRIVLDSDEEEEVIVGLPKQSKKGKEKEKKKPELEFLPSTKMKYMMDQIVKLAKEKPDEKTLVVSQWTSCLSLVSQYLSEQGIAHVKYQGDMNRIKRDQAVRVFMASDKAPVMLMSLKCGGVGLNLTRANNVISLDLGWSQAVEAQAFDRVHRLGQTRAVVVQRLVIENTVEDRVLTMQERKQTLADGSLGEGSGKKIGRLSVRELAALFGLDRHGNRIQAQDD